MIRIFNLTFLVFLFLITKANSLIEIDITRGNLDPLPIAVSPLFQSDISKKNSINELKLENVGSEISSVVSGGVSLYRVSAIATFSASNASCSLCPSISLNVLFAET